MESKRHNESNMVYKFFSTMNTSQGGSDKGVNIWRYIRNLSITSKKKKQIFIIIKNLYIHILQTCQLILD